MGSFDNVGAGALSGGAGGAAAGPWGTLIGAGVGGLGGFLGGQGASKAKRENEKRYRRMLQLLQQQGETTKRDIALGAKDERGAIAQSAIGRGIYNTSVLDSLNSGSYSREARDNANVDEGVRNGRLAIEGDRVNQAGPSPWVDAFRNLGTVVPGITKSFGGANDFSSWGSLLKKKQSPYAESFARGASNNWNY